MKIGRPSSQSESEETFSPKREKKQSRPSNETVYDQIDEMSVTTKTRFRRKLKNCVLKTNVSCENCKVNLCLNSHNSHFKEFHKRK